MLYRDLAQRTKEIVAIGAYGADYVQRLHAEWPA
jgi:hypothetical protein